MIVRSVSQYIGFGTVLRYLQDAEAGWYVNGDAYVRDNIERFLSGLTEYSFPVTDRAASDLRAFVERLSTEEDSRLSEEEAEELREIMGVLRGALFPEAKGLVAFFATDKRYDVTKLITNVGSLMSPGTLEALPTQAQLDLSEAGICIALERSTSAAFHMVRGTEEALRHLYASYVRRNRMSEPWLWQPMVVALRGLAKPPPAVLLDHLDGLRRNFRDPAQHPEKNFDIEEAQDLFAACADVLTRMVNAPRWKAPPRAASEEESRTEAPVNERPAAPARKS